ncbi:hypothetical protein LTR17_005110 [Elasticomyces elasticus]|nr:hypothetical protein LTR17_005110 [Elasticomyces elasticus]
MVADDTPKTSLIQPFEIDEGGARKHPRSRGKWRITTALGALAALIVLCANITLLIWSHTTHKTTGQGSVIVYTGSCDKTKHVTLWADLAINILSTILLSASNSCGQLLSAPTRDDIDAAHARSTWLDIGIQSTRNLRHIPGRRRFMWWMIGLSSVPLHLFYNSVVFSTLSANDYQAALVTEDFLTGAWWNETRVLNNNVPSGFGELSERNANIGQLHVIQQEAVVGNLTRLDNARCLEAYATTMYESNWKNVLVVTNLALNDTFIQAFEHGPTKNQNDMLWPCDARNDPSRSTCDIGMLIAHPATWTIPNATQCQRLDAGCEMFAAHIEYCLAEPFQAQCTAQIATPLLIVVIIFNAVKVICIAMTAFGADEPLVTVGDAIASFLAKPDALTQDHGAISAGDVWSGSREERAEGGAYRQIRSWKTQSRDGTFQPPVFKHVRRKWAAGVSAGQYGICLLLCIVAIITGFALLGQGISTSYATKTSIVSEGLGTPSPFNMVTLSVGGTLVGNVLLANTPQIIISFLYLFYNRTLTSMLLTAEYCRFARVRSTLRVSKPKGKQKSTYWLNIPWNYSGLLMTSMATLHWLVARSIFLMKVSVFDNNGVLVPAREINACGYSPLAILVATLLGVMMTVVLIGLSYRRLDAGIPIAASCSVAIAAACHQGRSGMAEEPLMYGVVEDEEQIRDWRYGSGEGAGADGRDFSAARGWVGFSSKDVSPLEDGVVYR